MLAVREYSYEAGDLTYPEFDQGRTVLDAEESRLFFGTLFSSAGPNEALTELMASYEYHIENAIR